MLYFYNFCYDEIVSYNWNTTTFKYSTTFISSEKKIKIKIKTS